MILISGIAHAEVSNLNVSDFNFNYTNPHGEGSAAAFSRSGFLDEGVYVTVDKEEKDFLLHASGSETGEFRFKNAPAFMTDAETMTVAGFNLNLAEAVSLSLTSGRFNSPKDILKIDGMALNCNRNSGASDVMNQLITGCIEKLVFKNSKFNKSSDKSDLTVNSADLKINTGKFDLTAEIKAQISGKVKANGNVSYDEQTSILTIKVSEVKLGILNVRGQVFSELKKSESDKMKVKEPYVYLTVK